MGTTLYKKIWDAHIVRESNNDTNLIYVDRHLCHEVTSPQAFEGLRFNNRKIRHPQKTFATMDHNVSTKTKNIDELEESSKIQMNTLSNNCKQFGVRCFEFNDPDQGVIHIIGPELGLTLPGMVIVCGDSHTATHGAFGALAFGIGTSEVEHVLATQTLQQNPSKTMLININGTLCKGVTPKDIILYIIGKIGTAGATGYVVEYAGETIRNMSIEGRMTICNMSIEAGARGGMIAPDEKTFKYLKDKDFAPKGDVFKKAVEYWKTLKSDPDAIFDKVLNVHTSEIEPQITWGTSPQQVIGISEIIPDPDRIDDSTLKISAINALKYMGLKGGTPIEGTEINYVFIGSCTNGRIEDLRVAANILKGKKVNPKVTTLIVPGSGRVKRQAEKEGLDKIFIEAGCQWRHAGCSMCLGMNDDKLKAGDRCVSTTNRNFEGRQGPESRTHLSSPEMAAFAAIEGKIVDVRKYI